MANKYPEIIIDKTTNSLNAEGLIYKMTAEQYQDILHHTHKIGDLIGGDGATISAGEVSADDFEALKTLVNTLSNKVTSLETENGELKQKVQNLESSSGSGSASSADIDAINGRLNTIENNIGIGEETGENTLANRVQTLETNVGVESTGTQPSQTLTQRVQALESGSGLIIDFDLDTPGVQDQNGNTVG